VPTGIKIFSWLSHSFSKNEMAYIIRKYSKFISNSVYTNLLERFPRAKRNYLPCDNDCNDIVPFGSNLSSIVNYPYFTIIIRHMIQIPQNICGLIVGILISDGYNRISDGYNRISVNKEMLD
jgi:hypothetical protein